MTKINKEMLKEFVQKGFFDSAKTNQEVIDKLDSRGFSIVGKKAGLIGQLLTFLCQEGLLEREKDEKGSWRYKKAS